MEPFKYLVGYPPHVLAKVQAMIEQDRLGTLLADKYGELHAVRSDGQLYDYVQALKERHLRKSVLKTSREIRIATVFRDAPAEFLRMIVVHELAHMKVAEHDKAFYRLCAHMEPTYHQLEFDVRLYLTHLDQAQRSG